MVCLLVCSCTSITWRDGDGVTHHLGFFAYRIDEYEHGTLLTRSALGGDLRLAGPSRGYCLGLHRSESHAPRVVNVNCEEFPDAVASSLGRIPQRPRRSRRGFFYLRETLSDRATLFRKQAIGGDIEIGPAKRGFSLGYRHTYQLIGPALDENVAQIHLQRDDRHALILWTLRLDGED